MTSKITYRSIGDSKADAWILRFFRPVGQEVDTDQRGVDKTEDQGRKRFGVNLIGEIVGTFILVFVVGASFSRAVAATGPAAAPGPYLVAVVVWGIGLSLGDTTGYAINPARDLGPLLAHALLRIAGKGQSDWSYAIVPVPGPLMGGAVAGGALKVIGI